MIIAEFYPFLSHNISHCVTPPPFPPLLGECGGGRGELQPSADTLAQATLRGGHCQLRVAPSVLLLNRSTWCPTLGKSVLALPLSKMRVTTCAYLLPWFLVMEFVLVKSFKNEKHWLSICSGLWLHELLVGLKVCSYWMCWGVAILNT